ncbi:MAG: ABC transporter permease subunit [Candidatus Bathyarchaeota archaeon]|nr:ABC transporter permease subunit [Candidatus Bathyarchaeota archaeon]
MGKGKPFLEVLASALNEDYKFPILEVFALLYTLGTFVFANFAGIGAHYAKPGESVAFSLVNSLAGGAFGAAGLPVLILVILIMKNIAYGLGNDLDKGIIQTFLSYPLKRRLLLTAKLLSSLGVALLLFIAIQLFALSILAPEIVSPYIGTVLLTFAAVLSYPLLVASLVLAITLFLKRGNTALIVGIVLYFASGMIPNLLGFAASAMGSNLPLKAYAIIDPNVALTRHYITGGELWTPTFNEALLYIGASYALVISIFIVGYLYFERRLEI